jgi:hypothetical protein
LKRGIAATGNTKPDVAKKIIAMGEIVNKRNGDFDPRYVEWRKYIKTHKFPHRHTRSQRIGQGASTTQYSLSLSLL